MSKLTVLLILFFSASVSYSQYNGRDFSIGLYGAYTTSASIFLNPDALDIVLRNESFDIEDIFNPGVDVRYKVSEAFIVGFNVEYIKATATGPNLNAFIQSSIVTINVEDGFRMIPIELSAYYLLPFSTEDFKFLMGGGLAYYDGEFLRKLGDEIVTNIEKQTAFGIHVSVSMDYIIHDNVAINFGMKFRDPQLKVKSKYNKQIVEYQGHDVTLAQEPFDTKIDMDGITFVLGLAVQI